MKHRTKKHSRRRRDSMWVGHFKISHDNCVNLKYTRQFNVVDSLYPITHYFERGYLNISFLHLLAGKTEDKRKFRKSYAKDPRVVKVTGEGDDYFIAQVKTKKSDHHTFTFYDRTMFFLRPVVHTDVEDWLLGAWDKKYLERFYTSCKKYFDVEVVSIGKQKVSGVFIPNITPFLTPKQKEALELACLFGYYDFPRQIYLEELAAKLGISRISFQERLHKAEGKILPKLLSTNRPTNVGKN